MLQIFALELRAQEKSPNFSPLKIKESLALLFTATSANSGNRSSGLSLTSSMSGAGSGSGIMPIMTLLDVAVDLPVLSLPSVVSPALIRCLQAATVPYTVSRGGRSSSTGEREGERERETDRQSDCYDYEFYYEHTHSILHFYSLLLFSHLNIFHVSSPFLTI